MSITTALIPALLGFALAQEPWFSRPLVVGEPLTTAGQRVDPFLIGQWVCSGVARLAISKRSVAGYSLSLRPLDQTEPSWLEDRPSHSTALGAATFLNVTVTDHTGKLKYILFRYGRRGAKQLLLRLVAAEAGLPERGLELSKELERRADEEEIYVFNFVCEKR